MPNSNKKTVTILVAIIAILAVGVGIVTIATIAINGGNKVDDTVTAEDLKNKAAKDREDAIAQQLRLGAEIYELENGFYPYDLADYWGNPDALPGLQYSKKDDGFVIIYRSANGKIVTLHNE